MLFPEKQASKTAFSRFGFWNIIEGEIKYLFNLWLAVPLTLATGFFSSLVGISGGSFLVPLMMVGCGVPMRTAFNTATVMLAATALMGFAGTALHGGFDPALAIPCTTVAVIGGLIGGRFTLMTKPNNSKQFLALLPLLQQR